MREIEEIREGSSGKIRTKINNVYHFHGIVELCLKRSNPPSLFLLP